jgi:hypothetical protein
MTQDETAPQMTQEMTQEEMTRNEEDRIQEEVTVDDFVRQTSKMLMKSLDFYNTLKNFQITKNELIMDAWNIFINTCNESEDLIYLQWRESFRNTTIMCKFIASKISMIDDLIIDDEDAPFINEDIVSRIHTDKLNEIFDELHEKVESMKCFQSLSDISEKLVIFQSLKNMIQNWFKNFEVFEDTNEELLSHYTLFAFKAKIIEQVIQMGIIPSRINYDKLVIKISIPFLSIPRFLNIFGDAQDLFKECCKNSNFHIVNPKLLKDFQRSERELFEQITNIDMICENYSIGIFKWVTNFLRYKIFQITNKIIPIANVTKYVKSIICIAFSLETLTSNTLKNYFLNMYRRNPIKMISGRFVEIICDEILTPKIMSWTRCRDVPFSLREMDPFQIMFEEHQTLVHDINDEDFFWHLTEIDMKSKANRLRKQIYTLFRQMFEDVFAIGLLDYMSNKNKKLDQEIHKYFDNVSEEKPIIVVMIVYMIEKYDYYFFGGNLFEKIFKNLKFTNVVVQNSFEHKNDQKIILNDTLIMQHYDTTFPSYSNGFVIRDFIDKFCLLIEKFISEQISNISHASEMDTREFVFQHKLTAEINIYGINCVNVPLFKKIYTNDESVNYLKQAIEMISCENFSGINAHFELNNGDDSFHENFSHRIQEGHITNSLDETTNQKIFVIFLQNIDVQNIEQFSTEEQISLHNLTHTLFEDDVLRLDDTDVIDSGDFYYHKSLPRIGIVTRYNDTCIRVRCANGELLSVKQGTYSILQSSWIKKNTGLLHHLEFVYPLEIERILRDVRHERKRARE